MDRQIDRQKKKYGDGQKDKQSDRNDLLLTRFVYVKQNKPRKYANHLPRHDDNDASAKQAITAPTETEGDLDVGSFNGSEEFNESERE